MIMFDRAVEWLIGLIVGLLAYWVRRLDKDQERQDRELKHMNQTLTGFSRNVGAGDATVRRIESKLDDHIRREEEVTWKRIEDIDAKNEEAHRALTAGLMQLTGDVREMVGVLKTWEVTPRAIRRKR